MSSLKGVVNKFYNNILLYKFTCVLIALCLMKPTTVVAVLYVLFSVALVAYVIQRRSFESSPANSSSPTNYPGTSFSK